MRIRTADTPGETAAGGGPSAGAGAPGLPDAVRTLFSRNWAFVDEATQRRLDGTVLFTAGTGLGSVVAVLAARTGFGRFILADGDVVELSNLNRQAFLTPQLGHNKADAVRGLVLQIRADARVEVLASFLDERTMAAPIERADIVVNTVDFDDPVFLACNRIARENRKPVLLPMNLGFGGAVIAFLPDSPSIEDVFAAELAAGGPAAIRRELVLLAVGPRPQPYQEAPLAWFLSPDPALPSVDPQLGIAAGIAASLTVAAAISIVRGEPVRSFPDVAVLDAWTATRPAPREGSS